MKNQIICAAIKLPNNQIIRGQRHSDCIDAADKRPWGSWDLIRERIEGFMTAENVFVGRKEAMEIAITAGQVSEDQKGLDLFSEDIY